MGRVIKFERRNAVNDICDCAKASVDQIIVLGWNKETDEFYSDTNMKNAECMYILELAKRRILYG